MCLLQLLDLFEHVAARLLHMLQQLLLFQRLDQLQRNTRRKRSSAKRGSMHAGMNTLCDLLADQQSSKRQSAGNRFGDRDQIGLNSVMLVSEPAAGASEAALDFIGDQQRVVFFRELVRSLSELFADRTYSAFALQELEPDGANSGIEFPREVVNVIEIHELHAGNDRRKGRAIFLFVRRRQRTKRPPVERMFQGQN